MNSRTLRVSIVGVFIVTAVSIGYSQFSSLDLSKFGYAKTVSGRYAKPAFASLSYVGENSLFVTFPKGGTSPDNGQQLTYIGLVLDKSGALIGQAEIGGGYDDVLQRRINIQPSSAVLVEVEHQLRIYNPDLKSYRAFNLPLRSEIRVPPDRQSVVAISQDGNKSVDTIVLIATGVSHVDHLDFDERAVRDGLLAVANDSSVAHAVRDSGAELAIHSWSRKWAKFEVGKYQQPMAFTAPDELLVSVMATTPFPPNNLYLWKSDGTMRKVRGSKAGFYTAAQSSLDGNRVLMMQTNVSFFGAMLGGFDCGDCGESDFYSVVDALTARVILKHHRNWNCNEALSPSGKELAELCDGIIRFYPVTD